MKLIKGVLALLVIGGVAGGALYYIRPPTGTWVVDQEATREAGGENILSRLADGLISDYVLELADEGTFKLMEDGKVLFTGNWELKGSKVLFTASAGGGSLPDDAEYGRPGTLTVDLLGKRTIFKRR